MRRNNARGSKADAAVLIFGVLLFDALMGTIARELVNARDDAAPWALAVLLVAAAALSAVGGVVAVNIWRKS